MNISTLKNIKLEAICSCVPHQSINNKEFAFNTFNDRMENTINAVGIETRHICENEGTTATDLCVSAAKKLFETCIKKKDIGALVFVTLTPDYLMPNNASFAQDLLGLDKSIPAFDINHACSGYIYGLWISAIIANNLNKKVLLLDGDVNSKYVSKFDKSTSILFGDAGTATVISPTQKNKEWNFSFNTDGSKRESIVMKLGFKNIITHDSLNFETYSDGSQRRFIDMNMNGEEVFNYVVSEVPKFALNFFDELEILPSEIDKLLLHQANAFMLRKLSRKIGFEIDKVPFSISKFGNTSSASIPLTICSEMKLIKTNDIICIGMGAGLATGIAKINLSETINCGVIFEKL